MTDIVERLRDRSDHYIAQHAMDTMDDAASEIERLRARIEAARAILEKDDDRGSHSEGLCIGACLKAKLKEALLADDQQSAREELTRQAQELDMGYGQSQK